MDDVKERTKVELKQIIEEAQREIDEEARTKPDGWKVLKDPGELQGLAFPVATVEIAYHELQEAFGDPWVWGPRTKALSGPHVGMATQWALTDPDGNDWYLESEWPKGREIPKCLVVKWVLGGPSASYETLGYWLATKLKRKVTITCTSKEDGKPEGKVEIFTV